MISCVPLFGCLWQSIRTTWPWLWRSWQSGRFRHQRSVVWIPTSAKFYLCISVNCNSVKTKIEKKRPDWTVKKNIGELLGPVLCNSTTLYFGHFSHKWLKLQIGISTAVESWQNYQNHYYEIDANCGVKITPLGSYFVSKFKPLVKFNYHFSHTLGLLSRWVKHFSQIFFNHKKIGAFFFISSHRVEIEIKLTVQILGLIWNILLKPFHFLLWKFIGGGQYFI